ncbi:hypothetical protein BC936DRAFT_139693, partial [Jimgerdemannia flammicorona]
KKKFKSAKERRDLKKQKEGNIGTGGETSGQDDRGDSLQAGPDKKQVIPQPARGKRGKIKKMKDKYAEQDDEERELRMELLGVSQLQQKDICAPEISLVIIDSSIYFITQSAKGPQPKGKKGKKDAERKAQSQARGKGKPAEGKTKNSVSKPPLVAGQETGGPTFNEQSQASVKDVNDGEQDEMDNMNEKDDEEVRQLLKEENIVIVEGEDAVCYFHIISDIIG